MIISENRCPFFGIMLYLATSAGPPKAGCGRYHQLYHQLSERYRGEELGDPVDAVSHAIA